jgi:hypothetical protein
MDADLSHHPKYIPVMIEYINIEIESRSVRVQILYQGVDIEKMEVFKDGVSIENLPVEQLTF